MNPELCKNCLHSILWQDYFYFSGDTLTKPYLEVKDYKNMTTIIFFDEINDINKKILPLINNRNSKFVFENKYKINENLFFEMLKYIKTFECKSHEELNNYYRLECPYKLEHQLYDWNYQ